MYKVIQNKRILEEWVSSNDNITGTTLYQENIRNHLMTVIELLDTNYGADRNLKEDLGGFLILFYGRQKEISIQVQKFLDHYKLKKEEYEFEDTYTINTSGKEVVFRLYLCSSDYAFEVVIINM